MVVEVTTSQLGEKIQILVTAGSNSSCESGYKSSVMVTLLDGGVKVFFHRSQQKIFALVW